MKILSLSSYFNSDEQQENLDLNDNKYLERKRLRTDEFKSKEVNIFNKTNELSRDAFLKENNNKIQLDENDLIKFQLNERNNCNYMIEGLSFEELNEQIEIFELLINKSELPLIDNNAEFELDIKNENKNNLEKNKKNIFNIYLISKP